MASEAEVLSLLVTAIFDAALDHALWPFTLERICDFVGGPAAMLFSHDGALNNGHRFFSWGDDPHYTQLYFKQYAAINPINPAQMLLDIGEVKAALDLVSPAEFADTRFYREWAEPQGYVDNVFAIVDKSSTSYAALAVTRDKKTGVVDARARRRMRLLAPHVRRAVVIGNMIDLRSAEASLFENVLGALASAVLLVDAGARIVFANDAANALLDEGIVMRRVEQNLCAADPQAEKALRAAFAATAAGDGSVGTKGVAVLIVTPAAERWLAHVLPLTSGARQEAWKAYAATAAVFVRRASPNSPSAMETVAKLYKLTATELRVLQSVVDIGGAPEVAAALGISEATVKTHLQHLFTKTGARRQIDLVKLVAGSASPFAR